MSQQRHKTGRRSAGLFGARALGVLRACRVLGVLGVLLGSGFTPIASAQAQGITISYPQEGQAVRGRVKVLFEGIPEGGYGSIYVDLKPGVSRLDAFRGAVNNNSFEINTLPLSDGRHTVTVIGFNASGRRVGQAEVGFNVANSQVDVAAEQVRLRNWTNADRIDPDVQRYRVFAESNATISGGMAAGGMGGGGGAPPGMSGPPGMGGAGGGGGYIAAPLDWQVDMLIRRIVRDVQMVDGSANIKLNVKEAFHRQREGTGGAGAMGGMGGPPTASSSKGPASAVPTKGPWDKWVPAPETGQYFVKMIMPTGQEINATRKAPTIALGDLSPLFPEPSVQPGSRWETEMTLVAELSKREAINVRGPMLFTNFENLQTQAGVERRTARLESEFDLPENVAMRIAKSLQAAGGSGGAGGMGGMGGPPSGPPAGVGGEAGGAAATAEISVARTHVRRIVWFDIAGRRVLRSEDYVDTYYEEEQPAQAMGAAGSSFGPPPGFGGAPFGAGGPGGAGMAPTAPAEPTKVNYNLRVVKYLDDTIPPPTDQYNAGAGTAHARDSVQDPSISRVTGRR